MFHNKLDKKAVHIIPEDILVNFDINCDSHIRIINDLQIKNNLVQSMQFTIQSMVEKIILVDDHYQLLNELIGNSSIDTNKIVLCVTDHISDIQSENHLQQLAKIMIALQCFDKKSLNVIIDQVDSMNN
ncbi:unnamed protein product [Adineta ricciae]|uniref:Uncharacterized protein n=1 Tax=Adineta ricciae TaxID=249248 RepID=A0A815JFV3_ADIRI|nr:unnamed protein product [Adineta ricciae]